MNAVTAALEDARHAVALLRVLQLGIGWIEIVGELAFLEHPFGRVLIGRCNRVGLDAKALADMLEQGLGGFRRRTRGDILAGIVVMSVLSAHRNIFVISLAIGGFAWPATARILRAEIFRVKSSDYVMASEALGLSGQKTLWRHVMPNSIAPVIVVTTLSLSGAIVAEAVLSFLGVGLPPAQFISWGNDISVAQSDLRTAPQNLIYPSIALSVTVLAFIMLGEVVRDALDPKARAQR